MIDATKAGIRFQSKKLEEFNREHLKTRRSYDELQKSIVDEVMNITGTSMKSKRGKKF